MTVSIRPGTYTAFVYQRPNGDTRRGAWQRYTPYYRPIWWLLHPDERVVYLVRAILPPRNITVANGQIFTCEG
jgi:hypothetical protein